MFNSFLKDLELNISEEIFSSIILPNKNIISQANKNIYSKRPNILRLDGCDNFKGNFSTLLHILFKQKYIFNFPEFFILLDKKEIVSGKLLSKYLSRNILKVFSISDAIIFQSNISKKMYENILDLDTNKKNHFIINNGTLYKRYKPITKDLYQFGYPACFVSASNFRAIKRLDQTILFCNYLRRYYPNIKLHIVGNVNQIKRCNKKLFQYEFITQYGFLKFDEIRNLMRYMDIQFHLSCSDACPNAVIEGLMAGLPVISPHNTGTSELLGPFKDKWCVDESIELGLFPSSLKLLPKLPYAKYLKVFAHVFDNLNKYKSLAHEHAVTNYDLNKISKKYVDVVQSFYKNI